MRVLYSTVLLAFWSLYVWVFDPLHIEDKFVTDLLGFSYWAVGAGFSIIAGLLLAGIWGKH